MRVAVDFEFTSGNQPHPRVLCCALRIEGGGTETYWCDGDPAAARRRLLALRDAGAVFTAYAATAEARCFHGLGIPPTECRWVDLHAEFRALVNWCNKWRYGLQWVPSGVGWAKKRTRPPRGNGRRPNADKVVDENGFVVDNSAPLCTLANAKLKFLGTDSDPNRKDAMRDLILEDRPEYAVDERTAILAYCASDVADLLELHDAMSAALRALLASPRRRQAVLDHQLGRGRWAADTALIEHTGIPIHLEGVKRLSANVPAVVERLKDDVVTLWPFWVKGKDGQYVEKREQFSAFLEHKGLSQSWPRTATGQFRRDADTLWENRHVPECAALAEAKLTEKQLNWYAPDRLPEFLAHVGDDGYLRPYYGIFGTQSGRNAAKARCFPPAQSRWLRCLIRPKPGTVIVSGDYESQEFLVAALLSGDRRMMAAYASGDVYLAFGRSAGMIPPEGTKQTHPAERAACKVIVLGTQYGMGAESLASSLSHATKRQWFPAQADRLLHQHRRIYSKYWDWVGEVEREYRSGVPLVLQDGWPLFPDNPNPRSVANYPVQGTGAVILRRAVRRLHDAGLRVSWPLHDGVYVLSTPASAEADRQVLTECMRAAAVETVGDRVEMGIVTHIHRPDELWTEEGAEDMVERFREYVL
jgi:DNA polymerase-1